MNIIAWVIAAGVTFLLGKWLNKMSNLATRDYNTQAYVDPESIPPRDLLDKADQETMAMTQFVKVPMAQVASPTGELISQARLNPSFPNPQFGNTALDTPTPFYKPNVTG